MRFLLLVLLLLLREDSFDKREADVCDKPRWSDEQQLACRTGFIEGSRYEIERFEAERQKNGERK